MSKVTIFKNVYDTKQPHFIAIDNALNRIKNGHSQPQIQAIRAEKDYKKRTELKKNLPSVCFSGVFMGGRDDKNLKDHSGFAIFDFDKLQSPEYFKEELTQDEFVFSAWISPSGTGVKALVKIPPDAKAHRLFYSAILDHFPGADRGMDDSNINESRVCFESWDPDLYLNWNSQIWTEKKIIDQIQEPQDHSGGDVPHDAIRDHSQIYKILKIWMDKKDTFVDGNRHNFYVKFAFNLCEFGVSLEDSIEWLLRDYPHENGNGAENSIKSGWQSKEAKLGTKHFKDNSLIQSEYLTFWDVVDQKEVTKVFFNRLKFIEWLHRNGVSRLKVSDGKWIFIQIRDQIARYIFKPDIKHLTFNYIKNLPSEFDGVHRGQVLEMMAKGVSSYFSDELLDLVEEIPINWNRDKRNQSFFYYQNTVVNVGAKGFYCINYSDLPGVIWETQIINRAFVKSESINNDFRTFCNNVCDKNDKRFESLRSIIGYLLTDYKDPGEFPTVVLMDEQINEDGEANGGTGKGMFAKGIRNIKVGVPIDGRNWTTDKSFAWQRIGLDTKLICIEDVDEKFNFEKFYSITAEGFEVEKKNKDSFYIPFEDSPKIIITTNYTIKGEGNSTKRRLVEIEFSTHYNENFNPKMDFGKLLFNDWDDDEWNCFDNFMMDCVKFYLSNHSQVDDSGRNKGAGIIKPLDINKSQRKLLQITAKEFVEWADIQITIGKKYDRKTELFKYFTDRYPDFAGMKTRTFNRWCKSWGNYRGYNVVEGKSGNNFYFTFLNEGDKDLSFEDILEMPF